MNNKVFAKTLTLTFNVLQRLQGRYGLDVRVDELFAAAGVRSNDTSGQPWRALRPKWAIEVLGHKYTSDVREG